MSSDHVKQDILRRIREIADRNDGHAPGREKFQSETGIKPHEWRGKIWRNWSDAVAEAGFAPNELQAAFTDDELLRPVLEIAKDLRRFPSFADIDFEARRRAGAPGPKTIAARWKMFEMATALHEYAERVGEPEVAAYARAYKPPRRQSQDEVGDAVSTVG